MSARIGYCCDGRALAWAEFGPAHGRPVLYCHGGNDCRLDGAGFAGPLTDLDVRLIVPDRRFGDWGDDVAALLDHLELATVPIFGLSGGGPHCLGALAGQPTRFERAAG